MNSLNAIAGTDPSLLHEDSDRRSRSCSVYRAESDASNTDLLPSFGPATGSGNGVRSGLPLPQNPGDSHERFCSFAHAIQPCQCACEEDIRFPPGPLDSKRGHEGCLATLGVHTDCFSEFPFVSTNIQQVIDNLKTEPDVIAEFPEGVSFLPVRPYRQEWRPLHMKTR